MQPEYETALKIPPHNIEAEQAVVGGCFLDDEAADEIAFLKPEEFYRKDHRLIFETIMELNTKGEPYDAVTVAEVLEQRHLLDEAGGMRMLGTLAENTPSACNIKAYADIVHKRALLREILKTTTDINDKVFNPEGKGAYEIADYAAGKIYNLTDEKIESNIKTSRELVNTWLEQVDYRYNHQGQILGLKTGFVDLDNKLNGLEGGDLVIVAGRPAMGKTSLAINIGENLAVNEQKSVAIFSLEMPATQLIQRINSSLSGVPFTNLKTGELDGDQWSMVTKAAGLISQSKIHIDDTGGLSVMQIRSAMRKIQRKHGLDLVIIDYLQLMTHATTERNDLAIAETTKQLKSIAKEFNIPIILLSQLNRSLENRTDRRPRMSDLRDSGAIEQDADIILFLYRDEVYNPDSVDKGIAEVIIGKQRNGETGVTKLVFKGQFMKFDNLAQQWSAVA